MKFRKRHQALELETVTNGYDIRIKMACMSCAHRDLTRARKKRLCCVTLDQVSQYHVCEKWTLSEQLEKAGSGQGVVRDRITKEVVIS